jgi:hypothetical protein
MDPGDFKPETDPEATLFVPWLAVCLTPWFGLLFPPFSLKRDYRIK